MDDQQLCHIVHEATASGMFPRGTHSGETMAVARAVREACAKVADAYAAEVQSGHWLSAAEEIARRIRAVDPEATNERFPNTDTARKTRSATSLSLSELRSAAAKLVGFKSDYD